MVKEALLTALESLGFNRNEALVYLELIKMGKASPLELSKRTKIHRSNMYDILEKLFEKGIVDKSIESNKKIFYPVEPKDLLDYLKQKEKQLEEILPEMERIYSYEKDDRVVTISEGINSAKNIISHLIDLKEPIFSIGAIPKELFSFKKFFDEFNRLRIKKKITLKYIFEEEDKGEMKKFQKLDFTEVRYMPTINKSVLTFLCGDKILILIWNDSVETILLKSLNLKEAYKTYFDFLWEKAKTFSQMV
jgi:sugar-specific transcriptional regulator TrmB